MPPKKRSDNKRDASLNDDVPNGDERDFLVSLLNVLEISMKRIWGARRLYGIINLYRDEASQVEERSSPFLYYIDHARPDAIQAARELLARPAC